MKIHKCKIVRHVFNIEGENRNYVAVIEIDKEKGEFLSAKVFQQESSDNNDFGLCVSEEFKAGVVAEILKNWDKLA